LSRHSTNIPFQEYENRKLYSLPDDIRRTDTFMQQQIFTMKYSEINMMRQIQRLGDRDIGLAHSMIALGSCTMKLTSAITMIPVTWSGFANIHPFVPADQC
jgi:glycine dehydrogenase